MALYVGWFSQLLLNFTFNLPLGAFPFNFVTFLELVCQNGSPYFLNSSLQKLVNLAQG